MAAVGAKVLKSGTKKRTSTGDPTLVNDSRHIRVRFAHEENAAVYLSFASRLFTENDIPRVAEYQIFCTPSDVTGLFPYLAEKIGTVFRCHKPAYIIALDYLRRIARSHSPYDRVMSAYTYVKLVTVALMVATKFIDDVYYTNIHYSEVLGRSDIQALNTMERVFLTMLNCQLNVTLEDYSLIEKNFEMERSVVCQNSNRPVLCGPFDGPVDYRIQACANVFGIDYCMKLAYYIWQIEEPSCSSCSSSSSSPELKRTKSDSSSSISTSASEIGGDDKINTFGESLQQSMTVRESGYFRFQSESEYLCVQALLLKAKHLRELQVQATSDTRHFRNNPA